MEDVKIEEMKSEEIVGRIRALRIAVGAGMPYILGKLQAKPYLQELNKRGKKIAKKHNVNYSKFQFAGFKAW